MILKDVVSTALFGCCMTVLLASAAAQSPTRPPVVTDATPTTAAPASSDELNPTLPSPCNVCGSGFKVEFQENLLDLGVQFISCGRFETDGLAGLLPAEACSAVFRDNQVKPQCGCVASGDPPVPTAAPVMMPSAAHPYWSSQTMIMGTLVPFMLASLFA